MGKTNKETRDLVEIEKWIKERKGHPAIVKDTDNLLRIKFDTLDDDLEVITWAKFFQIFKEKDLRFVYSLEEDSRFCKFLD